MAIYHLEAKVISRGAGRSAVAAAAYMSCSQILNDYDGVQHDYTRKQGLAWQQIFLPEYAPAEWSDRGTLWNAVEENEKTKDSRLAREFVVALPIEMGKAEWQNLLTEFIQNNFVADGMCTDVCIHDTDGHNPHAHIMVTVRPLAENGQWQYKTEKEYLCVRDGEESRERKGLLDEKKATSVLNILKQRELAKRIAQLSEDIEELRSEKAMILSRFDKTDDDGMKDVKQWVASMESSLQRLEKTEAKYQAELDAALAQFRELAGEAESMDKAELHTRRQGLRKTYTQDARDKLLQVHGKQYSPITMMEAQQDVDHLLREDERKLEPPVQKRPVRHQPEPRKKPPKRDYER